MPWWAWLLASIAWALIGLGAVDYAGMDWRYFLTQEDAVPYVVGCIVLGPLAWPFVI